MYIKLLLKHILYSALLVIISLSCLISCATTSSTESTSEIRAEEYVWPKPPLLLSIP